MQSIPNELLCDIFKIAVYSSAANISAAELPVTISHVCSRWREVALSTSNLWCCITLAGPAIPNQLPRAFSFLSRSRQSPLDLLLDFRDPAWDWDEDNHLFDLQFVETIIRQLMKHIHRWRSVDLRTDTWSPIFTFLWCTKGVEGVPLLESLALSRCNAYLATRGQLFQPAALSDPVPLFGGRPMDRLKELSLIGVHVEWTTSSLQNLTHLELKYHSSNVMPSVQDFQAILHRCPALQQLSILGWGPRFGPGSGSTYRRSIRLHHLTHLSIGIIDTDYAIELLSLFYFPALEELVVEDLSAMLTPSDRLDATPVLEWWISNHSSCPSTSHSSLCCGYKSFPLHNISSIELHGVISSTFTFKSFFRQFERLEHLFLFDTELDAISALSFRPSSSPPQRDIASDITCPLLSHLQCKGIEPNALFTMLSERPPLDNLTFSYLNLPSAEYVSAMREKFTDAGVKDVEFISYP